MRDSMKFVLAILALPTCLLGFGAWLALRQQVPQSPSAPQTQNSSYPPPVITASEFDHWMKERSNWGRWGKDDQLGAVNLITAAKRQQALALAKEGMSVSLAHPPLTEKAVDVSSPFEREVFLPDAFGRGIADRYSVFYHGRAITHLDALCHMLYKWQMYNGYSYKEITKERGCAKNGIQNMRDGIITRAVLIDIPRLKGLPYLAPDTAVYPQDIEAWEKKVGIKVSAGDAILLRTGRWARRAKFGPFKDMAGYHATVAPWFKSKDVSLVGSDAIQDLGELPGVGLPIHIFVIAGLGVPILDNLDLEAVAETAAKLNRWEFLIQFAPIPVEGGTGSPVNPIATF